MQRALNLVAGASCPDFARSMQIVLRGFPGDARKVSVESCLSCLNDIRKHEATQEFIIIITLFDAPTVDAYV